MTERRYVVPEGMLKGAEALFVKHHGRHAVRNLLILETAIEWLAENPVTPTDEQIHKFYSGESEAGVSFDFLRRFVVWWQRNMMFTDQELDVPPGIEVAIRGQTLTREQADRIIGMVNRCVPPEPQTAERPRRG